tara:strand:+ start:1423 stop:2154 length:732 start_codon:yes stop_codon:yes gene_type:complete
MIKKLLDTAKQSGNTKVAKTGNKKNALGNVRMASLSMMPHITICPGSKAAGCMDGCLKGAGLAAVYKSVNQARQARTDYWTADQSGFLEQLRRELTNFEKLCNKQSVQGVVRLNVLSDIPWEQHDIPQSFPGLFFYDYTKRAARLGKTPDNYRLMFSYSGRPQYRKQVLQARCHDNPIAVVFSNGEFPETFLNRPVVDGDQSDLWNVQAGKVVVGLKAKGPAKDDDSGFVVDLAEPIKFIAVA